MITNLSLQQLFGDNAYQDIDHLVISKGDLYGLSATSNNTAESLLVAIIVNACRQFEGTIEDENNQPITDENNVPITFNNSNLYDLLNILYWKKQYATDKGRPIVLSVFGIEVNEVQ